MRLTSALALSAVLAAPLDAQQVFAPAPHTTPGVVTRITLFQIKPGQTDAFWTDIRANGRAVNEELKRQGVITSYGYFTNVTFDGRDDWNVGVAVSYPNWAALDNLAQRTDAITLRHYGTAERRTAAARARNEYRDVMASFLVRDQVPNPMTR